MTTFILIYPFRGYGFACVILRAANSDFAAHQLNPQFAHLYLQQGPRVCALSGTNRAKALAKLSE